MTRTRIPTLSVLLLGTAMAVAGCGGSEFTSTASGGSDGGGATGSGGTSGGGAGGSGATGGNGDAPNGTTCAAGGECTSGYCVDGYCCDSDCTGTCRACDVKGSEGACSLYAAGSDPEHECAGSGQPGDACNGSCNAGACQFPGATTTCAPSTCSNGSETDWGCDAAGGCVSSQSECAPYVCGSAGCLTSCSDDTECAGGHYCEGSACQGQKANGESCGGEHECESGFCVSGTCCNSSCAPPFECGTGTCSCNGAVCPAGDQCVNWYADSDDDTFGDPNVKKLGCSSIAPSGGKYVKDNTDCYDKNDKAFPGQTEYQTTQRGDNSFDYDCNGSVEVQYPNVAGLSCARCFPPFGGSCVTLGCIGGWGCNGTCPSTGPMQGFVGNVACGQPSVLNTCTDATGTPACDPYDQTQNATQGCR